jgi:GNAT superfamily N-acetyltransferase
MPRLAFDPESPWKWLVFDDDYGDFPLGTANLAPSGYVWGVEIFEPYRGRGLGRELMRMMAQVARSQGHCFIRLRVHHDNEVAINLYMSLGYLPTEHEGLDSNGTWVEFELEFE